MKSISFFIFASIGFIESLTIAAPPTELTIDQYLEEVLQKNLEARASSQGRRASQDAAEEGRLTFLPSLNTSASYLKQDFKPSTNPYPTLSRIGADVNIVERTPFGIDSRAGMTFTRDRLSGFTSSPLATTQIRAGVSADLTRNFLGQAARAERDQIVLGNLAESERSESRLKQILVDAEATYWEVVIHRLNVNYQKDALERADKLLKWNKTKSNLELVNAASLAQAEANFAAHQVQVQMARENLRQAASHMNSLRQQPGSEIEHLTSVLSLERIQALPERTKSKMEVTLRAEFKALEAERARLILARSRNTPSVAVSADFISQAEGTLDKNSKSISHAAQFTNPGYQVGIQISTPLVLPKVFTARAGQSDLIDAAEMKLSRIRFVDEQNWKDLQDQYVESIQVLKTRTTLEEKSQKRLQEEQKLFDRGRSTTFQVVQAEQDFADAQLARLSSQASVLRLYAQMKLFD